MSSTICTMINCTFTFPTANVFGCFRSIMPQLKEWWSMSFQIRLHCSFICRVFKSQGVKQSTMCQRNNHYDMTNYIEYLPWTWTASVTWYNDSVEKRKISYFGLALNLFQHLISPNQDDLFYSARTFISGFQNGWAAKPTPFGLRRRPEQTFLWPSLLSDAF